MRKTPEVTITGSPIPLPGTAAARVRAAELRDAAHTRVRRFTIGVLTLSVAAAGVGAVVLAEPAPAGGAAAPAAAGSGVVAGNGNSPVVVSPGGARHRPVAVTGGS